MTTIAAGSFARAAKINAATGASMNVFTSPTNFSQFNAVATDSAGNTFATGFINDPVNGNGLTVKLNSTLGVVWTQTFDGAAALFDQFSPVVVLLPSGYGVVGGTTRTTASNSDAIVIRYAAASPGTEVWRRVIAGATASGDSINNLVADANGDLYASGAIDNLTSSDRDGYVSKITGSSGASAWITTRVGSAANFTGSYTDPNGDPLTIVRITSLSVNGVLKLSNVNVTLNQNIPIANIGNLTYTTNLNYNGGDNFGWNGSNGAFFAASAAAVNLTIAAVNAKPTFTAANPPAGNEDAGAQTVVAWATFNPGAANEAGQAALAYSVSNISNGALFSAPPGVAANGTLTYTPAANANGSSTFQVLVQDNGGTTLGGVDLSDLQTFTITVNAVNDAPVIIGNFSVATPEETARTILLNDLLVNDVDNSYPTGFTLTAQNGANYTRAGNAITPVPGFVGTLSVPVQVNDGAANSNVFSLTVTVNPTDAHAANSTTIVPEPGGGFRITFLGSPGVTYVIPSTNSLTPTPTAWRDLGTHTADAHGRYNIVDLPPANTPVRFYRSVLPYRNNFNASLGTATLLSNATWTNQAVQMRSPSPSKSASTSTQARQ